VEQTIQIIGRQIHGRVDSDLGLETVQRAIGKRGADDSHCYPSVLNDVAELQPEQVRERLALDHLSDPIAEVAGQMAVWL